MIHEREKIVKKSYRMIIDLVCFLVGESSMLLEMNALSSKINILPPVKITH
jgi:hypothetical protein